MVRHRDRGESSGKRDGIGGEVYTLVVLTSYGASFFYATYGIIKETKRIG